MRPGSPETPSCRGLPLKCRAVGGRFLCAWRVAYLRGKHRTVAQESDAIEAHSSGNPASRRIGSVPVGKQETCLYVR